MSNHLQKERCGMNYGLLVFKETDNIGDDIQTYAAERFLPRIDCLIDRESTHIFCPDEGEAQVTAVIMNAWFMYHKYNWPPSPFILPYFTAVHVSEHDFYQIGEDFFTEHNVAYFQKYAPVGCRDRHTLNMFEMRNIKAYFSGCLTLTLDKQPNIVKKDRIYLVDVDDEIRKKTESFGLPYEILTATHDMQPHAQFDWNIRREAVQKLLAEYQSARLVVTTRLHCALPCLALGTNVILIYESQAYFKNRIEDYLPYIRHYTKDEYFGIHSEQLMEHTDQQQNVLLCEWKQQLADGVKKFLDQAEAYEKANKPNVDQNNWYGQLQRQSELMKMQLPKLKWMHNRMWELEETNAWQKKQMENLKETSKQERCQIQEWYEKREAWFNEKIKGMQEWYEKRENWSKNERALLKQEIVNLTMRLQDEQNEAMRRLQDEQNEVLRWKYCYDTLTKSRALRIGNQILYWPRKIKRFFIKLGEKKKEEE